MPGLERINRCGRLIEGARRDFLKYYLQKCPTLFHICYDPIGTHRKARAFVGFLFGLCAAVALYEGIIVDLQFDTYTSAILGAVLVAMLSIGCASSIQVISLVLPRPRDSVYCRFVKAADSSNLSSLLGGCFSPRFILLVLARSLARLHNSDEYSSL